jgi:hypothetical protein
MSKKSVKSNGITRGILSMYSKSVPELFHPCPFSGKINVNASVDNKIASFLPEGTFRFKIIDFNKEDRLMFALDVTFVIEK